jgi:hypothetical protein
MRAYWSAASVMTGRASFAELAKNLRPSGHLPPSGLVDQTLAVAPRTVGMLIATLGFSGLPRDVAP